MDLTSGKITDHLRHIAVPASIGFFFNTMFNVVDTLFAGYISTEALAALSISFPVFFIILAFVSGLSTGASALISNTLGEKGQIKTLIAQVLSFGTITYLLIAPLCIAATPFLFKLLGATGSYLDMAISYMTIIFGGSFFFILLYSANAVLLSHGNSRVMRNFLIAGFILNTLLDPWFLFGGFGLPPMGFDGIAIATVFVMFIGFLYLIYELSKEGYLKGIAVKDFVPQLTYFSSIARQSLPASFNMMTIGTGIFVTTYFVKNFGEAAVAAYGISIRIEQIALLPTIGLTMAALSIVGQNNGAGKIDRVLETVQLAMFYGFVVIGTGAVVMFSFPKELISLFSNDPDVLKIGSEYLRVAALISGAYVLLTVNTSALQGMKKPAFPVFIGIVRLILLPSTAFYTLIVVFRYGIDAIWYSLLTINWIMGIFTLLLCRRIIAQALEESLKKTKPH